MASRPFPRLVKAAKFLSFAALAGALITGVMAAAHVAPTAPRSASAGRAVADNRTVSHVSVRASREPVQRQRHDPRKHVPSAGGCAPAYTVRPGDTLSSISERCYGTAGAWTVLYAGNKGIIPDPDLIYPGQRLKVPPRASIVSFTPLRSSGRPAAKITRTTRISHTVTSSYKGTYGCGGLEALWERAGGSTAEAPMAADIAMAESGGVAGAISPTDDYGLWQINASNGRLATLDPLGNARSAVYLSRDGTDWSPWTTYRTGAYEGRC